MIWWWLNLSLIRKWNCSYPVHVNCSIWSPGDLVSRLLSKSGVFLISLNTLRVRCICLWYTWSTVCTRRCEITVALVTLYLYDDTGEERRRGTYVAIICERIARASVLQDEERTTGSAGEGEPYKRAVTFMGDRLPYYCYLRGTTSPTGVGSHQPEPHFQSFTMPGGPRCKISVMRQWRWKEDISSLATSTSLLSVEYVKLYMYKNYEELFEDVAIICLS